MPREGTHTRRTNYAVNLRVYTRTRNNAGNFGRLHGSRGNVYPTPAGVGTGAHRVPRRIMWRSAWFMRAVRAKNVGTSVVYIGRRKREPPPAEYRHDTVTNEREKGEKVHMRTMVGNRGMAEDGGGA